MVGATDVGELTTSLLSSEEFRQTAGYAAVRRREHDELSLTDLATGLRLYLSPHDVLNRQAFTAGAYETHLTAALRAAVTAGMTVCCVGANVGYHALHAASRVGPSGRVVAFEARPENARLILLNAAVNGLTNVTVLPLAVADRAGRYRYVPAQGTNGYIEPIAGLGDSTTSDALSLVQAVCLDSLRTLLSPLDVLQMDVEGAEGLVVTGALGLIDAYRPTIFSELCLGQLGRTSSMSGHQYLGMLASRGYEFAALRFDGGAVPFGGDAGRLLQYAAAQPTSHIDIRCQARRDHAAGAGG